MNRLLREFFTRNTLKVARALLGQTLVRETLNGSMSGMILETEAYFGWDDEASHASRGKTKRNEVMFGPPGHAYIYLIYGIHHMFNVVAKEPDANYGGAVLIRAVKPLEGLNLMQENRQRKLLPDLTNGPGKLSEALGLDISHNGSDLCEGDAMIYFMIGEEPEADRIRQTARVGVTGSEEWINKPWRFVLDISD